MSDIHAEIRSGQRFEFGKNWSRFLSVLDEDRICQAERSLCRMLDMERLAGETFLDAGSGSGLFSLAARRLGARVVSFDYDPASVRCAEQLRERYFPGDPHWTILEGSVLDAEFVASLGKFDIVYSWGVLHHTGAMWQGMKVVSGAVREGGRLFIMIYPDLGLKSKVWRVVKRTYCAGTVPRCAVLSVFLPYYVARGVVEDLASRKNPCRRYLEYKSQRGMSKYHDWIDWLGGYPYEVAHASEIDDFLRTQGFDLLKNATPEYIFRRRPARAA